MDENKNDALVHKVVENIIRRSSITVEEKITTNTSVYLSTIDDINGNLNCIFTLIII